LLRWVERWTPDRLDGLGELAAPGYVHHAMTGADLDVAGFQGGLRAVFAAFPDLRYEVVHSFASGGLAGAYVKGVGTHRGTWFGLAPTGSLTTFTGIYHARVESSLVVEDWDVFDLLTPLLSLGGRVTT
jgi:predicted ester cyclase